MGVWGGFCCSAPHYGGGQGGRGGTRTGTHTGTYTRMLHLLFSDLPLQKCPTYALNLDGIPLQFLISGWPRFGSVTVGGGTVRPVPVFGSGGSTAKRVFLCFSTV